MASHNRRSAILEAAVAEFSAHGYQGGRIERIAASAGANKQLIFHYFGSKDGLYEAAVDALLPATEEASAATGSTPIEAIRNHIERLAGQLLARPGFAFALAECSLGSGVPATAARIAREWTERQRLALRAPIEDGQRMGFFRDAIDAQSVADAALASLVGWVIMARGESPDRQAGATTPSVVAQMVADYCTWK